MQNGQHTQERGVSTETESTEGEEHPTGILPPHRSLTAWDSPEHIREIKRTLVINGKPTEFADVHTGRAIYIGRANQQHNLPGSEWANPYPIKEHGRDESLRKYVEHLTHRLSRTSGKYEPTLRSKLLSLYGKPLVCWCIPEHCHGDVLALYLAYRLRGGLSETETFDVLRRRFA